MAKRDLAKDDQGTQCPFGKSVRGRHAAVIQKHEPFVLMFPYSILQRNGFFVSHGAGDQSLKAFTQPGFLCRLLLLTEFSAWAKAMKAVCAPDQFPDVIKERKICCAVNGEFLPVACCASQMRETFLLRTSRVSLVAGVTVRHERAREILAPHIARDLTAA